MKSLLTSLVFSLAIVSTASGNDAYIIGQQRYLRITPQYERWNVKGGDKFSEFSFPVVAYYPFSRYLSMTLRGSQARASGDNIETINGITDTQLSFSYHFETANLVFNLGLNLPSGKKSLSVEEFETSSLISNNIFNFKVPGFGQGLNISPGLMWALPVNENVVLGLGASYQFKGEFEPVEEIKNYKPGNELLFTAGIDVRLNETANFSGDIIFTAYGTDKLSGEKVFASGNKWVAHVQFKKYFNYNDLWLYARYRNSSKNEFAVAGILVPETEKNIPNQIEFLGHFRYRFNRTFALRFLGEGRFYEETPATFSGINLFGLGLAPEISLSSNIKVPAEFKFLFGDLKDGSNLVGVKIAVGLLVQY